MSNPAFECQRRVDPNAQAAPLAAVDMGGNVTKVPNAAEAPLLTSDQTTAKSEAASLGAYSVPGGG